MQSKHPKVDTMPQTGWHGPSCASAPLWKGEHANTAAVSPAAWRGQQMPLLLSAARKCSLGSWCYVNVGLCDRLSHRGMLPPLLEQHQPCSEKQPSLL